jgi:hypothetical protein
MRTGTRWARRTQEKSGSRWRGGGRATVRAPHLETPAQEVADPDFQDRLIAKLAEMTGVSLF